MFSLDPHTHQEVWLAFYSSLLSVTGIKQTKTARRGKGLFQFTSYSPSWREIQAGAEDRNLEAGIHAGTTGSAECSVASHGLFPYVYRSR